MTAKNGRIQVQIGAYLHREGLSPLKLQSGTSSEKRANWRPWNHKSANQFNTIDELGIKFSITGTTTKKTAPLLEERGFKNVVVV